VPKLQWIASFLAMTALQFCGRASVMARCTPLRHCEARSAVAIHGPVPRPQWIASFLAMAAGCAMTVRCVMTLMAPHRWAEGPRDGGD
jgi:hypothetical protein